MHFEISIAVNYILSNLYTKLPRRRVDSFGEELQRSLCAKFQNHWFPNEPLREAAFRCLNATATQVDLILSDAASISGLDWNEIQACLPDGLVISIDPGQVSCQYNQPGYASHEINKFSNSSFWPSASVSLSSSGCSSASSSASSTNMTNNSSTQVTQQVLYSIHDSLPGCNKQTWNERLPHSQISKKLHSELENGDNLATAAALSVLVEPEDTVDATVDCKRMAGQSQYLFNEHLWNADLVDPIFPNDIVNGQFEPLQRMELINGSYESGLGPPNLSWPSADPEAESALVSLLSSNSNCVGIPGDRNAGLCHVTNRSASNPAKPRPLGAVAPLGGLCEDNLRSACNVNSMTNPSAPAGNAVYPFMVSPMPTTSNTHYTQKSMSTPSFTAATFAQTKFGSTKLKSHTKRAPSRILAPQSNFVQLNETGESASRETSGSMTLRNIQSCFSVGVDNEVSSTGRFRTLQNTEITLNGSVRNLPPLTASLAPKLTDSTTEVGAGESTPLFNSEHLPMHTPLESQSLLVPPQQPGPSLGLMLPSASSHPLEVRGNLSYPSVSGQANLFQAQTTNNGMTDLANYFEVSAMKRMGVFESIPTASGMWPTCAMRPPRESMIKPHWLPCEQNTSSLAFGVTGEKLCDYSGISSGQCVARGLEESSRPGDTIDFSDNAILPTRMVNLLLEEDGTSETGVHEQLTIPAISHLSICHDHSNSGKCENPNFNHVMEEDLDLTGSLVHLSPSAIEGT